MNKSEFEKFVSTKITACVKECLQAAAVTEGPTRQLSGRVNYDELTVSIVKHMKACGEPVSLQELTDKAGHGASVAQVRKAVKLLIAAADVEQLGERRGTRYKLAADVAANVEP